MSARHTMRTNIWSGGGQIGVTGQRRATFVTHVLREEAHPRNAPLTSLTVTRPRIRDTPMSTLTANASSTATSMIRRLSVFKGKSPTTPTSPAPSARDLAQFLDYQKVNYRRAVEQHQARQWSVVMGNEAGGKHRGPFILRAVNVPTTNTDPQISTRSPARSRTRGTLTT